MIYTFRFENDANTEEAARVLRLIGAQIAEIGDRHISVSVEAPATTDPAPADPVEAARRELAEAEAALVRAMDEMQALGQKFNALMSGNKPPSPEKRDMIKRVREKAAEARKSFDEAVERRDEARLRLEEAIEADPDAISEVGRAAGSSPKSKVTVFFAATSIKAALRRGESVSAGYEIKCTPAGHTHVIITPQNAKPDMVVKLVKAQGGVKLPDGIEKIAGFASDHGDSCILIEGPKGAQYVEYGYMRRTSRDCTL